MTFRIAHVTDVHVTRTDTLRGRDLFSKRVTGAANAAFGRGRYGRSEILDALIHSVREEAPDHVALTGDLTQLSLPAEFAGAVEMLERFGLPAGSVSVIPGNHDCYVRSVDRERLFERSFARYMQSDAPFPAWPLLKLDGPVAAIGLSTAVPTPMLFATGTLGREQLLRLDELLAREDVQDRFVLLLIHHPVLRSVQKMGGRLRGLTDAPALLRVLARHRVDLILHGHEHRRLAYHVPTAGGQCLVIGGGSASRLSGEAGRGAQYNVYWIDGRRLVQAQTRQYDVNVGRFVPEPLDFPSVVPTRAVA